MFALPAGLQLGWLLYERARALTGAASHISGWLHLLLSDVDGEVRALLEQLGQRVEALTPALTFALHWSSDKGSAVSDAVFAARAQLFRIEAFIHSCAAQQGQMQLLDRDWMIRHLKTHLRELDFSLLSVNLCVSLITASSACQPQPQSPSRVVVSASALLRASERLQSMHATGGDVTISFGALYRSQAAAGCDARCGLPLDASVFLTDADHFSADPDKKKREDETRHREKEKESERERAAAAAAAAEEQRRFFAASCSPAVDSELMTPVCDARTSLNASIMDEQPPPPAAAAASSPPSAPPSHDGKGEATASSAVWERMLVMAAAASAVAAAAAAAAADGSVCSAALLCSAACLLPSSWPAAALKIYRNTARNVYELHVESLAGDAGLADGCLLSSSASLSSAPSASSARRLRFELSHSLQFRCTNSAALGLQEDAGCKSQSSGLLDVCFSWTERWLQRLHTRYAFMLLDLHLPSHARQPDSLRPLDIAYAARLCCYENAAQPSSRLQQQQQPSRVYHLQATDEELWLLFGGVAAGGARSHSLPGRAGQTAAADDRRTATAAVPAAPLSSSPTVILTAPAADPSSPVRAMRQGSLRQAAVSERRQAAAPLSLSLSSSSLEPASPSASPFPAHSPPAAAAASRSSDAADAKAVDACDWL